MTTTSTDLLRSLGSGVRPAGTKVESGAAAIEGLRFQDLLDKANSGEIGSGVPVRIAGNAGVKLTDSQLQRLSAAADKAEAQGAARAVVLIDGMALTLDVPVRTVTGMADTGSTGVLAGIDAVITVAPESAPQAQRPLPLPSAQFNPSLARVLERDEE